MISYETFGIIAIISLFVTAFMGFYMRKFGLKLHKTFAVITLMSAIVHFILQKI